jgi:hypothetical protein
MATKKETTETATVRVRWLKPHTDADGVFHAEGSEEDVTAEFAARYDGYGILEVVGRAAS